MKALGAFITVPKTAILYGWQCPAWTSYTYKVRAKEGLLLFEFLPSQTVINEYSGSRPILAFTNGSILYMYSNDKAPKILVYSEFRTSINSRWSEIKSVQNNVLMAICAFIKTRILFQNSGRFRESQQCRPGASFSDLLQKDR